MIFVVFYLYSLLLAVITKTYFFYITLGMRKHVYNLLTSIYNYSRWQFRCNKFQLEWNGTGTSRKSHSHIPNAWDEMKMTLIWKLSLTSIYFRKPSFHYVTTYDLVRIDHSDINTCPIWVLSVSLAVFSSQHISEWQPIQLWASRIDSYISKIKTENRDQTLIRNSVNTLINIREKMIWVLKSAKLLLRALWGLLNRN